MNAMAHWLQQSVRKVGIERTIADLPDAAIEQIEPFNLRQTVINTKQAHEGLLILLNLKQNVTTSEESLADNHDT